jgi:hypothetical protein
MANEISLHAQMILHNTTNNHRVPFQPPQITLNQNAPGSFEATAALTTSDTTLSIVGLTTYGYGFFQNISASSDVVIQIGVDVGGALDPFTRLKQKEFAIMRFVSGSTYRAETESSTGRIYYGVWED